MSIIKRRGHMCLTLPERKSVIIETTPRYKKAKKRQKIIILDEFCKLTGLTRNYSTWILRNHGKKIILYNNNQRTVVIGDVRNKRNISKRPPVYKKNIIEKPLIKMWEISDYLCSKRLVPFIRNNILSMNKKLMYSKQVYELLMKISSATIDRVLQSEKKKYKLKGRSTTKRGKLIKGQIPIRTFSDWNDEGPGFFEIDLVSHDGGKSSGDHLFTLNVTDISTGWTVPRAIKNKAQVWTVEALDLIIKSLAYPMRGIDSDNGSEFINHHLIKYCEENKITFTRGRPYKKNDNCYIEEKNNSVVRKTVGYCRYEDKAQLTMNQLYTYMSSLINFFQPSMRLISKTRIGSKIIKKYDQPQTPYHRLLNNSKINDVTKKRLKSILKNLDVLELNLNVKRLKRKLDNLAEKL